MQPFLWSLLIYSCESIDHKRQVHLIVSSTLRGSADGWDCRCCWLSFLLLYRPQILLHITIAITMETGYSTPMNSRGLVLIRRSKDGMLYVVQTVKHQMPNLWMVILSCINKIQFGFSWKHYSIFLPFLITSCPLLPSSAFNPILLVQSYSKGRAKLECFP